MGPGSTWDHPCHHDMSEPPLRYCVQDYAGGTGDWSHCHSHLRLPSTPQAHGVPQCPARVLPSRWGPGWQQHLRATLGTVVQAGRGQGRCAGIPVPLGTPVGAWRFSAPPDTLRPASATIPNAACQVGDKERPKNSDAESTLMSSSLCSQGHRCLGKRAVNNISGCYQLELQHNL